MYKPVCPRLARRFASLLFSALVLGGALAGPSGAAAAVAPACASTLESSPFIRFLDPAKYTAVRGGSFEQGAPGWTLSAASTVAGNESHNVVGGSNSLLIQDEGQAVSPSFCVGIEQPTFRLFTRNITGQGRLKVAVRFTDTQGQTHTIQVAVLGTLSGTGWNVTPIMLLDLQAPLLVESLSGDLEVELVFTAHGGPSQIDDVYYDPYSR